MPARRDPVTGHFLKGRSGNPRGRPRRRSAVQAAILKALAEPIDVPTPDGATRRITKLAAAAVRIADEGACGDARDGRLALDLALKAEERAAQRPRRRPAALGEPETLIVERLVARLRSIAAGSEPR